MPSHRRKKVKSKKRKRVKRVRRTPPRRRKTAHHRKPRSRRKRISKNQLRRNRRLKKILEQEREGAKKFGSVHAYHADFERRWRAEHFHPDGTLKTYLNTDADYAARQARRAEEYRKPPPPRPAAPPRRADTKAIDRARKLRRMAQSVANSNEARLARDILQQHMRRHGLRETDF